MTSIETQIYQIISAANGIKGSDIAAKIGIEKKNVNSTLANSAALKAVVYQDENYRWHARNANAALRMGTVVNAPAPDKDLSNLCNYYLNCLALESSSSVSQFLTSRYSLQYAVLNGLEVDDYNDAEAKNFSTGSVQTEIQRLTLDILCAFIPYTAPKATLKGLRRFFCSLLNILQVG